VPATITDPDVVSDRADSGRLDEPAPTLLHISIEVEVENGKVKDVRGCTCPRGKEWAVQEVTNPKRVVMSVVPVEGGLCQR